MGRLLGIDYGKKRIGVALSDPDQIIATPFNVLKGTGSVHGDADKIGELATKLEISEIVVGLPLNMDGTEGDQARIARKLGDRLARITSLVVHYFDERLTSHAANVVLRSAEMSRQDRRARRDKVAASIILQGFIRSQEETGPPTGSATEAGWAQEDQSPRTEDS